MCSRKEECERLSEGLGYVVAGLLGHSPVLRRKFPHAADVEGGTKYLLEPVRLLCRASAG